MAISTPHHAQIALAHIPHPAPDWNDAQRLAWQAAQAIYAAKDALYALYAKDRRFSIESSHRAWLAWTELEREVEIIGLFAEEEVKA